MRKAPRGKLERVVKRIVEKKKISREEALRRVRSIASRFWLGWWRRSSFRKKLEFAERRYKVGKISGAVVKVLLDELDVGRIDIKKIKGEEFIVALPWLYWLSFSENVGIRRDVAEALRNIGVWNEDVAEILGRLSKDENVVVRRSVVWALGELSKKVGLGREALEMLRELGRDKNEEIRREVAIALANVHILNEKDRGRVIEILERLRGDKSPDVRDAANLGLAKVSRQIERIAQLEVGKSWLDKLLRIWPELDFESKLKIAMNRYNVGNVSKKAMEVLEKLEKREIDVRRIRGEKFVVAVPWLYELSFSKDAEIRDRVAQALKMIRVWNEDVFEILERLSKDKNEVVRADTALALGGIGKKVGLKKRIFEMLERLSKDRVRKVRLGVAIALWHVYILNEKDRGRVIEILERLRGDKSPDVRDAANIGLAKVLRQKGKIAQLGVEKRELVKWLGIWPKLKFERKLEWAKKRYGVEKISRRVLRAIKKLEGGRADDSIKGEKYAVVIPWLWEWVLSEMPWAKERAAEALGRIGVWNKDVAKMFTKLSRDVECKTAAALALGEIGKKVGLKKRIFEILEGLSKDRDWEVRLGVAIALGNVHILNEKDRGRVIEILERLRGDKSPDVRDAANIGLAKVLRQKGKIAQLGVEKRELVKWLGIWPKLSFERKLRFAMKIYGIERISKQVETNLRRLEKMIQELRKMDYKRAREEWLFIKYEYLEFLTPKDEIERKELIVALPWLYELSFSKDEVIKSYSIKRLGEIVLGGVWEEVEERFEKLGTEKARLLLIGIANGVFDKREFLGNKKYRDWIMAMNVKELKKIVFEGKRLE